MTPGPRPGRRQLGEKVAAWWAARRARAIQDPHGLDGWTHAVFLLPVPSKGDEDGR